ncbi:MAG: hypothetical protein JWR67_2424 [Mucilaginibacter sp.]|nr:hypothetical protein [Mucilaginibacter sp.]
MQFLKNIEAPLIGSVNQHSSLESISSILNHVSKNAIANSLWTGFEYQPDCSFAIAHGNNCIFLKYFIIEDDVLLRFTQPNDLVYQDSCVEFFIAFNGEAEYYNLEFNCIGTCYLGYGTGNKGRETADVEIVKKIKCSPLLYSHEGKIKWELTLVIPNEVFFHHNYTSLASKTGRANFYKCGNNMPVPHYLSWNIIESEKPNFHLPDFFGSITFNASVSNQMVSSSI